MALADGIRELRDRALAELKAAHDYYSDTRFAWGIIRESVRAGNRFTIKSVTDKAVALEPPASEGNSTSFRSKHTGTQTTEVELDSRAREYIKQQLPEATFQQFISIFEAKASRDILVHNRGVANNVYESKAGQLARYKAEERIEIPGDYHQDIWDLICKMVTDISDAAISKAT